VRGHLKPGGKLLIVEYDINFGNPFVPYPVSYRMLIDIVQAAGFMKPELLARIPSRYWTQNLLGGGAKAGLLKTPKLKR
jgi:hypothetical protein